MRSSSQQEGGKLLAPSLRVTLSTGQRVLLITAKDSAKQIKGPGSLLQDPGPLLNSDAQTNCSISQIKTIITTTAMTRLKMFLDTSTSPLVILDPAKLAALRKGAGPHGASAG
jgi:hypothetical protein